MSITNITQSTSMTVTWNGITYAFGSPHPIEDLITQYNRTQDAINLWTQRLSDSNATLADLAAQIGALCVTPV